MTQLETIRDHIQAEFDAVNQLITTRLHSQVPLINQLSTHIINSGGKRIRPMLVLLSAKACDYKGNDHITLAAVIEFIHTATLLHDDVVDESTLRRGQETANTIWGSDASVLVGDFLYSRSFEMIVDVNNMDAMAILAKATNAIAEGEVMQLMQCHDPDTTEQRYRDVISSKTATLFQAAAQFGALVGKSSQTQIDAMAQYGLCLGNAFQLIDDALDYCAHTDTIGKNVGDDLADGKPTLPIIHLPESVLGMDITQCKKHIIIALLRTNMGHAILIAGNGDFTHQAR